VGHNPTTNPLAAVTVVLKTEDLLDASALSSLFATEGLIPKLHHLEALQRQSRYQPLSGDLSYWQRIQRSIRKIPQEYHEAAYCLFASVIFVPEQLRVETSRFLAYRVAARAKQDGINVPDGVHIFSVDNPELRSQFFDLGLEAGWKYRLDQHSNRSFMDVSSVIRTIVPGDCGCQVSGSETIQFALELD
jgi:hypothetical protein